MTGLHIVQTIAAEPMMRPTMPNPYTAMPGEMLTIEYKRSGQVVMTETFVCRLYLTDDGESLKRWELTS
jgi:hypothetical protein